MDLTLRYSPEFVGVAVNHKINKLCPKAAQCY